MTTLAQVYQRELRRWINRRRAHVKRVAGPDAAVMWIPGDQEMRNHLIDVFPHMSSEMIDQTIDHWRRLREKGKSNGG